ncbi:MAG: hypothetical protein JJT81_06675 [Rubellimicrobium sp.]|nr:hypothetical protein [Rubellimicrobium sp.]
MSRPSPSTTPPLPGCRIVVLRPAEGFAIDPGPLERLSLAIGRGPARDLRQRLHLDLDQRIPMIMRAYAAADHRLLADAARIVAETAGALGYPAMARVAADLVRCAGRPDPAALGAVLSRLLRLARNRPRHGDEGGPS